MTGGNVLHSSVNYFIPFLGHRLCDVLRYFLNSNVSVRPSVHAYVRMYFRPQKVSDLDIIWCVGRPQPDMRTRMTLTLSKVKVKVKVKVTEFVITGSRNKPCCTLVAMTVSPLCGAFYGRPIEYIYTFSGALAPDGILRSAKVSLRLSLAFCYIGSVTARRAPAEGVSQTLRHGTRNGIAELSQRAPPILSWAAITLGISPHCSYIYFD